MAGAGGIFAAAGRFFGEKRAGAAAPPKDYTLFVGTDKTAIQSTDNLFGDMAEKSGQSPAQVRDTIIQRPVTNPEQKTTRYIPVTTILFYGYLAGAAAFLLYQGVSYALFRRTVRRWKRDVSRADYAAMLSDTARDLGVSAPEMIVCEAISTPAVTGLLRPRLLLPHEHYDVQELRYILRHELCHLKRRDMLLKLVLLAANAMHWFNPVVYLMLRQADEDIELACDSAATDGLELPERAAYSRTLLAAVQSSVRALPATTCFGGHGRAPQAAHHERAGRAEKARARRCRPRAGADADGGLRRQLGQ